VKPDHRVVLLDVVSGDHTVDYISKMYITAPFIRIVGFNSLGVGPATKIEDPETNYIFPAYYLFHLADNGDTVSAPFEVSNPNVHGSGSVSLKNNGWVFGQTYLDAFQKALEGSFTNTDTGITYELFKSGAFKFSYNGNYVISVDARYNLPGAGPRSNDADITIQYNDISIRLRSGIDPGANPKDVFLSTIENFGGQDISLANAKGQIQWDDGTWSKAIIEQLGLSTYLWTDHAPSNPMSHYFTLYLTNVPIVGSYVLNSFPTLTNFFTTPLPAAPTYVWVNDLPSVDKTLTPAAVATPPQNYLFYNSPAPDGGNGNNPFNFSKNWIVAPRAG
jgi:hypothetical protein